MIGSGGGPGGYGRDWEPFHLDTAKRPARATARDIPAVVESRRGEGKVMVVEGRRGPTKQGRIYNYYISKRRADAIENDRARIRYRSRGGASLRMVFVLYPGDRRFESPGIIT
jgi:hypothetical protein